MLLAWSLESLPVPILSAILWTFLVLVPVSCISATAAMSALSVLWQRSRMSSGKKLPFLNLGILRFRVPTQVLSILGRYPFLLLPDAEHISSASASMTASIMDSASSRRFIVPSANFGISPAAAAHSLLCHAVQWGSALSTNLSFGDSRF